MSQRLRAKYNQLILNNGSADELIDECIDGVDDLLPIIDRLRTRGFVIMLKWDGGRGAGDSGPYDFLLSGHADSGVDSGRSVRTNHHSLEQAILTGLIKTQETFGPF